MLIGCSSAQPVSQNVKVTTQQQKIDAEEKAEAIFLAKKETELKAQLVVEQAAKVQAEEKAKIESDAKILAEEKAKIESDAKIQAEEKTKKESEAAAAATTVAKNKIVEQKPVPKQNNSAVMVWLSATGTKYHSINNCGRMNPDNATQVTLDEAKNSFDPCSKCGPPQ